MAIFQPTNIIPSSFTQGTVDAVKDNMEISWQVNGNSAMTAFQIDFYLNDTASTFVWSTGRKTDNCPFYGTDRFGRPQFFTYNAEKSWAQASMLEANPFTNGNNYKFKITQWYEGANEIVSTTTNQQLNSPFSYWFEVPEGNSYSGGGIRIIPDENIPTNTTIYYNLNAQIAWIMKDNELKIIRSVYHPDGIPSGAAIRLNSVVTYAQSTEGFLLPTTFAAFITRTSPTLTVMSTDNNFNNEVKFPNNEGSFASSIGYFHAAYKQAQGDPIRWIRWQVATATYNAETNQWVLGEILADTGDIYTPTLNYEFNGFFNSYDQDGNYTGKGYAIRCFGESESGEQTTSNPANNGWIYFNIKIENQGKYTGTFTAQCLHKENAMLLEWEGVEVIPPTISPSDYQPTIANSSVSFLPKNGDTEYSISWDKQGTDSMSFPAPYTVAWKGKLFKQYNSTSEDVTLYGNTTLATGQAQENVSVTLSDVREDPTQSIYKGSFVGRFDEKFANITNIVLSNVKGAFRWEVAIDNQLRTYTITMYSYQPASIATANAVISYEYYSVVLSTSTPGTITNYAVKDKSSNITLYEVILNGQSLVTTLYTYTAGSVSIIITITYELPPSVLPQGKLLSLQGVNLNMSIIDNSIVVSQASTELVRLPININAKSVALLIYNTVIYAFYYSENALLSSMQVSVSYTQQPITSVSIYGGDSGATVDSVSVYQGDGSNILSLYENPNFEPVWNSNEYQLYMTANFNGNLEGGTGTSSGKGFQIYRQEVGKNVLTPIANVQSTITSLKDYGISSRKAYKYSLYAYDSNSAFMSAVEADNVIATCFKNYSLLVCDYDYDKDEYHVRKQYLFALNLSSGSVGNNNIPTLNANFTQYPTRMPSTQNYASGTLSGLIGAIYTVPALIEQIGQYKYTAKPSTLDYFDSVDLEKELYDLSTAAYQLFLRDMKGRLRMIATSGAISMTTNIKQKQQSISISFPWVEIGDASDVTIIQTPDDYGWNNDNQVLDVQLDVDVATGELSATYPFPYNGTKFYLTGVNKENLTAKTPLGITPAQFNLSDVAEEPNDGEVTATVKVNGGGN